MTRLLRAAALVAAAVAGAGAAQPVPDRPHAHDVARLRAWIDGVSRHLPGQGDAAAKEVASWSKAQLEVLYLDLESLFRIMANPDRPRLPRALRPFTEPELRDLQVLARRESPEGTAAGARRSVNRLVKRGTLLHTDIALLVLSAADNVPERAPVPQPRIPTRTGVQVADGRRLGVSYYGAHWDFARLLLDEVVPGPASDHTARRWYQTMAAVFASQHMLAESKAHLERARQLFPADAEVLAASGRFHETSAAPGIQAVVVDAAPGGDLAVTIGSARSNLRQAQSYFSKAVAADGGLAVPRVHLGRILGLEGRHEEAALELRRAAMAAGDTLTRYYAELFLGLEEQSLGRLDVARESFNRAAALYPRAQSPYLALGQLARRKGDRAAALDAIQHVLALPADDGEREDPWWVYLPGSSNVAMEQLSELRALLFLTPDER